MPRYKVLKSVAHNLGHSFLSDMNMAQRGVFVPEVIFQLAAEHDSPQIHIDFIKIRVEPEVFEVREITDAVAHYGRWLRKLVVDQGSSWEFVEEAGLMIRFDLDRTTETKYHPKRPKPELECVVEIVDDRGTSHFGYPDHWWTE